MKSKHNTPLFYKIYFSVLAVFVFVLLIGCIWLSGFLKSYNASLPETVAEDCFKKYFVNIDADRILELSGAKPCEFETRNQLRDYIFKCLSNQELSYTGVLTGVKEGQKGYIVKSGENKVADFVLTQTQNNKWELTDMTLHMPRETNRVITVLDSSKLYINGILVGEKYVTQRTPHKNAEYLPKNVPAPQWVTYSIEGLAMLPSVTVTDRNGNTPELVSDKDGVMVEQIIYDKSEPDIIQRLEKAAKQYASCMQNDASKNSTLVYFEKGTDLYESIRTAANMFVWDHSGYAFEDESISEFFRYDDKTVSVRIAFTHILKRKGSADYRDVTDITYFARLVNGKYQIFARYNT